MRVKSKDAKEAYANAKEGASQTFQDSKKKLVEMKIEKGEQLRAAKEEAKERVNEAYTRYLGKTESPKEK